MSGFCVQAYNATILPLCFKKKDIKLLVVALIVILGFIILFLVWWFYDIRLTEIDDSIKQINRNK